MEIIQLPHKVADYTCPINGLEDQYEWKTGVRLPGYFFMDLSNIGFCYIKQKLAPAPRMVFWGQGVGPAQYEFLSDVVGFKWNCVKGHAFDVTWQKAKNLIDQGIPVVMGILDMYHLPYYPKFYHHFHIPQHFVQLVGYDDEKEAALIQDNGLPGIQVLKLSDLRPAWNINNPGQGSKNTFFTFEFGEKIAGIEEIVKTGIQKQARNFLKSPKGFLGLRGMHKAAAELPLWSAELSESQWTESLKSLATFTCSVVPNLPQGLLKYPLGYADPHQACRDRFSADLFNYAQIYHQPRWQQASGLFQASGSLIGQLTDVVVKALLKEKTAFDDVPALMKQIADTEEQAFRLLE